MCACACTYLEPRVKHVHAILPREGHDDPSVVLAHRRVNVLRPQLERREEDLLEADGRPHYARVPPELHGPQAGQAYAQQRCLCARVA